MKFDMQYECMNKECNTVVIYKSGCLDGIRCPRCDGPVMANPFKPFKRVSEDALYVRRIIIEHCKKHCFDLTPEQVETVLEIYKSRQPLTPLMENERVVNLSREVVMTGNADGWATFDYVDKKMD